MGQMFMVVGAGGLEPPTSCVCTAASVGTNPEVVSTRIITLPLTLTPGTRLGPYEILSALGAGGMGEVYRARDTRLVRDVAIKVLPPAFPSDAGRLARFNQEARAAAALNHPNILAVYDIGTHDGAPYIVSKLLEGETLTRTTDTRPPSDR